MAASSTSIEIIEGTEFPSFNDFLFFLKRYEEQEKEVFTIKNSKTLASSNIKDEEMSPESKMRLKYLQVVYACKFGGTKVRSVTQGERESSTFKRDCPAFIQVKLNKEKTHLVIANMQLKHEGHAESKMLHHMIPENRRLSPKTRNEVQKLIALDANAKLIKNKLANKPKKKFVTYKDLSNIKAEMKSDDENDLSAFVHLLEDEYGCYVEILHDENKFKGLFFCNEDMRNSMKAWAGIVFVDGTYKLFVMNFTLFIFMVQDSSGRAEIVGVAILASEDAETLKWVAETFRQQNAEAATRITCFMGDKDMTERNVLKEVFPGVPIYLCLFHTLKTFNRAVSKKEMKLDSATRENCLEMLEQLAYSSSYEEYDELYQQFLEEAPDVVVDYFDVNWHHIRAEWTCYSMTAGNLNNLTNNRLESINKQIKQVVHRNSSLSHFADRFFQFLQSQNQETDMKTAKQFLKRPVAACTYDRSEEEYLTYLTDYAFHDVQKELKKHQLITFVKCDEESKECLIQFKKTTIKATPSDCGCRFRQSMSLPCKHIFAVRKYFCINLFDKTLCKESLTKEYAKQHQRSFRSAEPLLPNHIEDKPTPSRIVQTSRRKKVRTVPEKRKLLTTITSDLIDVASKSCNLRFDSKVEVLHQILSAWREGLEVRCETIRTLSAPNEEIAEPSESSEHIHSQMDRLSMSSTTAPKLTDVVMPTAIRTRGRPSGSNSTTTGFYPRKVTTRKKQ